MEVDKIFAEGMEQLENLPNKLKKSSREIHDLDIQCHEIMKKIDKTVCGFTKGLKKFTKEQKAHHVAEIEKLYDEADRLAKRKLALATELYDTVDHDIDKMDKTTKRLERVTGGHHDDEPSTSDGSRRKKKRKQESEMSAPAMNVPVVEMPVDPNEPVYCTCHQVSFGEMVCCDNTDCKVEWFHFQCVGMVSGPPANVKWYCENCRGSFKHVANQWNYETNEPPKKSRKSTKDD